MLLERDQNKLWDAALFLMEHDRMTEIEPIIKVLLSEILTSLDKPIDAVRQLEIAIANIDSPDDLARLRSLESTIKKHVKAGEYEAAHKILIEYISMIAVNTTDILASLLSFTPLSFQDSGNTIAEGYYRVGEVAKKMGVSTQTIKRHCEEGRFPGAKKTPGGHWRIPKTVFRTTDEQDTKAEEVLRRLDEKNRLGGEVDDEFDLL